jgi:hypothetical protein
LPTYDWLHFYQNSPGIFCKLAGVKQPKYHIGIEIDKLTNSIVNTISGDSFQTEVLPITKEDLKSTTKKAGWKFNWRAESKFDDRQVYKLTIEGNRNVVQGLLSLTDMHDHIFLWLIENVPFNFGKPKLYEGVAGNLVAFAVKRPLIKDMKGVFLSRRRRN